MIRSVAGCALALVLACGATASPRHEGPGRGEIVFFRPAAIMGAAVACPVRHKGAEIVELGRGKFARWEVPPGRYLLTNKTASVEVFVEAGETRYVRCQMKSGFLTSRADLQLVDREDFGEAGRYEEKVIETTG